MTVVEWPSPTPTIVPPVPVYTAARRPVAPPRRLPAGAVGIAVVVVALNLLVITGDAAFARALVGLPVTVIVPGMLVLTILGGRRRGWDRLLAAMALSLAVLILLATILVLLPGVALTTRSCLAAFDIAVAVLAVGAVLRTRTPPAPVNTPDPPASELPALDLRARPAGRLSLAGGIAIVLRVVPAVDARGWRRMDIGMTAAAVGLSAGVNAVALAVFGARQLNAGGGAGPAVAALVAGAVAFVAAVVAARAYHTTAAATVVYLLAAAVLLATSLRGEAVTGHDIKIEYRVFLDTLTSGSWQPGGPYPGYNSCLSLTVLPSFFAKLLGLSALDVFRVCFQLIFAAVPVGALLVARRLLAPGYAVLSAGLFIAFPTFVNDMPMLNRQEIALLFFVVGLLALLDGGPRWRRATVFVIAAAGLTVSHYSSAAVTAALLLVACGVRVVVRGLRYVADRRTAGRPTAARATAPVTPRAWRSPVRPRALWPAALTMVLLVVGWSVLTGSAGAFASDLAATARAVGGQATVVSDATRYSPLAAGAAVDDTTALRAYTNSVAAVRADQGVRPVPAACADTTVLPPDELAPTSLGGAAAAVGVPPQTLNRLVRHGFVVLLEVGAVLGCALLWWRRRGGARAILFAELGTAGIALLGASLLAPQFTDSYGLLRIYQQLLPVLGVAVVVALLTAARAIAARIPAGRLPGHRSSVVGVVTVAVAACLITMTGLLPRVTGGYAPQLNLANAGPYYRGYLAGSADAAMAQWIRDNLPADAWVVADSRDTANLRALTDLIPNEGVLPGAVPDDAHLLVTLGGRNAVATAVVGDRIIRYAMPLTCLTAGRSVVHIAGTHVLYSPYGR